MFAGQGYLQLFLLLVMFVCVPMMLFPKPLILKKRHEARNASGFSRLEDDDDDDHHGGHGGEEFVFSDVLVHQIIHTIEFVLGAVSNTASYLRLWALSLAHAQLSAVFWERILMMGISIGNPVVMVVCFFMWAMTTLGVLMAMESLSAFLHALRLHWVEFQNKFYQGDGYKFVAFSFVDAGKELTGTA
jgi:V-type H+-transporting ATPase subunit a